MLASGFSCVLGLLASPIVIACNSLIHKKSKDNLWGRIFSSLEVADPPYASSAFKKPELLEGT